MEKLQTLISFANDIIWTYLLIGILIICAVWFTVRTGFLQFRSVPEMFRILTEGAGKGGKKGPKSISSFQAFAVSIASRVGTGNLAGVATAIVVGGPGAVFWMWIMALLGSASAFVESTLAQLYKRRSKDGAFIGGPAYYMERGIGKRWMGVLFAVLISITFGFAFNSVQSNTICASWEMSFGISSMWMGIILTALTIVVIFGGIHRIAKVSSLLVPVMAMGYIILALVIVAMNIGHLPEIIGVIVSDAFNFGSDAEAGGWRQFAGGGLGVTVMQGIKRGLFSNEAGMGSAPNVAATADTSHPVKQGLIQALGVFTDTLIICSCTAFIILLGGVGDMSANGIQLTQTALTREIGHWGEIFVSLAILMFAFSSIIGNYYYGEANIRFITKKRWVLDVYRILVAAMVMCGALITLDLAWSMADLTMALMALCNLIAVAILSPQAIALLKDYRQQKKSGIKDPVFTKDRIPEIKDKIECW